MARVICVKKKYGANLPTLMSLHCKCHYNLTMPLMRLLSYDYLSLMALTALTALMALVPLMTYVYICRNSLSLTLMALTALMAINDVEGDY